MDGCGLAPADGENAVAAAKTPFLDGLYEKYPHTTLGASGEDVGLPDGQMGNSEVGHLNIGAGRIVFQELSRINNAIKDGSIAKNEVFVKAMDDVKADGKTLHLMGLMSPGGVHSHMNHVEALVKMAAEHGVKTVRVHAFMDGRDVDPQSGAGYMSEFCAFLAKISEETGCDARVATVSGRYWAMDRDNRWERIQRAYDVMVNASDADTDPVAGIKAYYEKDPRGDEFVEPFAAHNEGIHEGDAAIFFNFRPDRARQMTRVFTDKEFDGFERDAGMFVIVGIGLLMLMLDAEAGLHNPLRFFWLISNPGSVMTLGVYFICVYMPVALAVAVLEILKKRVPKWLTWIGIVAAFAVAAYTGFLLGVVSAALRLDRAEENRLLAEAARQIERVGLADRMAHLPSDLSGGQRQRVAIARALVGEPALILADEPTGNLDGDTAQDIMNLLLELNRTQAVTLVMVTHDGELAQRLDRRLHVQGGRITEYPPQRNSLDG